MAYQSPVICDQHPDRAECHDLLVEHHERTGSYHLLKGQVRLIIHYCPWRGVRLPQLLS